MYREPPAHVRVWWVQPFGNGIADCIDPCPDWEGGCSEDGLTLFLEEPLTQDYVGEVQYVDADLSLIHI